jgi:thioredoxin 1
MQKDTTENSAGASSKDVTPPDHILKEATHRHYRGGYYRVIGEAIHTETKEKVVVYEHLFPHPRALFVRPHDMFYGNLEDGTIRFAPIKPDSYLIPVTDVSFASEVLGAPGITVIDFWAPWCGPCKTLMPSLEKVAEKFQGRVKVVKMNVDENTVIPTKYGVRGIPNLIAFVDGNEVLNAIGAKRLPQVEAIFDKLVEQHGAATN